MIELEGLKYIELIEVSIKLLPDQSSEIKREIFQLLLVGSCEEKGYIFYKRNSILGPCPTLF